jgi:hypothetical protein
MSTIKAVMSIPYSSAEIVARAMLPRPVEHEELHQPHGGPSKERG